jgi:hypothetical protein
MSQASRATKLEREIERINAEAAQREREIAGMYESEVSALQNTIRNIEGAHNNQIQGIRSDFHNQIFEQAQEFTRQLADADEAHRQNENNLSSRIDEQGNQIRGELRDLETRVGQQFGRINIDMRTINERVDAVASDFGARFDGLVRQAEREEDMARMIESELSGVMGAIRALRPEKFAPGELSPIAQMHELTRRDIGDGVYQSAIAAGQQCVVDASRLESRLAFLNAIFNERLRETRNRASRLREQIDGFTGAVSYSFELDGETYEGRYDIDHWSHGAFTAVRERFGELNRRLDGAEEAIDVDIDELNRIAGELDRVEETVTACNDLSLRELIGSQLTLETAQRLDNALAAQGWTRGDNGNYSGDEREPFYMQYEDGVGNRVAIVVNAEEGGEQAFSIEVYPDPEDDEAFRQSMRSELYAALRDSSDLSILSVVQNDDCQENTTPEIFVDNRVNAYREVRRQTLETLQH